MARVSDFSADLSLNFPDIHQVVRVGWRLLIAMLIGCLIGFQRELTHKAAGLRTHMLVSLGTALLVVATLEAGMSPSEVSRVIQGLIAGIGFLGGGAILKLTQEHQIQGLTTAAGIWVTAAASVAAGLGQVGPALLGLVFGLLVLTVLVRFEGRLLRREARDGERHEPQGDA
jgi:putative Mg2+ transporter-C (MgtC) family protein